MSAVRDKTEARDGDLTAGEGGDEVMRDGIYAKSGPNGDSPRVHAAESPSVTPTVKAEQDADTTASTLRPDPAPSAKRRESQATVESPVKEELQPSKKRKRATSPPWVFPQAEQSTLKMADGRRASARHARTSTSANGQSSGSDLTPLASENESTGKLAATGTRARSASVAGSKSRAASPPWKPIEAEGPTTIIKDGVRKSGRQNRVLTEGPKRTSPRNKKLKQDPGVQQGSPSLDRASSSSNGTRALRESSKPQSSKAEAGQLSRIEQLKAQISALKPSRSFGEDAAVSSNGDQGKRSRRQKLGETPAHAELPPTTRKSRHSLSKPSPTDNGKNAPRIKLRFSSQRTFINPPHPGAIAPDPAYPPRPSLHQVIEAFELKEMQQPYSENERGPPGMEHFVKRNLRQAQEEGAMRKRLLAAAEPGGPLSRDTCSVFHETNVIEPPRQYARIDHLNGHVSWLRHLQRREKDQHRLLAKKLAYEALEKYKERMGPTEEDLEAERNRTYLSIYKQTVADIRGKWELVQQHVTNARRERWEAEQEMKRQARLQEQLAWSEEQVKRQRGEMDDLSDDLHDEDGIDSGSDNGSASSDLEESGSDSEVMSDLEDEADSDDEDFKEALDQDALNAYKKMREAEPDVPAHNSAEAMEGLEDEDETQTGSAAAETTDAATPISADSPRQEQEMDQTMTSTPDVGRSEALIDGNATSTHPSDVQANSSETVRQSDPATMDVDEVDAGLSDDESTDMDSEDYDSDEDMSDSDGGDRTSDASDDDSEVSGSEVEESGGLWALFSRKEKESFGLPTPVASAEDASAEDGEGEVESTKEGQAMSAQDSVEAGEADLAADKTGDQGSVEEAPRSPTTDETLDTGKDLVPQPALLRGTLRSYQHAGLDWLASLYRNGTNGILADEMGLGKTIQTISLLAHLAEEHEVWESHLIIVPTSVILNWVTEFQKFLPGFRVLGYYGSAEERQRLRRGWVNDPHHEVKDKRGYNVIVTSYHVAMSDINAIRNVQWHYLVLDEAHNIRNFMSQKWQVLIRLRTRARLMLTGTPLQNSLTELWSLLTFLTAGDDTDGEARHGSLEEFLSHWKEPVNEIFNRGVNTLSEEAQRVVEKLHVSLRPFLLRRLKSEVEKDLPKKTESVVVCRLSKRQRQLYQDYMGLADTKAKLAQGNAVTAGKVLLSLRQVCNHPDLFDPRPIQTSYSLEQSPLEPYTVTEKVVRQMLGYQEELPASLQLVKREGRRRRDVKRERQIAAVTLLKRQALEMKKECEQDAGDLSSLLSCRQSQRLRQRQNRLKYVYDRIRVTTAATIDEPVYGIDLRQLVTIHKLKDDHDRTMLGRMTIRLMNPAEKHVSDRIIAKSASLLQNQIPTLEERAETWKERLVRFAFVTPPVTAPVLDLTMPRMAQEMIRSSKAYPIDGDFAHEARMRSSIVFPDSRLLIYDSGKLQRLTLLLRELQAKGSRSLIFTQMTGTLNILEQFLSLLGLPYLRLDGSTPVERRQLYTAEFNRPESKYQCMILSSRAGGVGLNLVGASSVIFFDLDWNPQMDRQCMDRAHRIGQVRDVEVFKMVSEKTVEENILRRANQKSLLDQTVIQEGHFTTEHGAQRSRVADLQGDDDDEDMEAALERAIGGGEKAMMQTLESVEDREDVQAAKQARREEHQDDADFADHSSKGPSVPPTPGELFDPEADEERKGHVDLYMIRLMERFMDSVPFVPPVDKNKRRVGKDGRDPSHRPKRKR